MWKINRGQKLATAPWEFLGLGQPTNPLEFSVQTNRTMILSRQPYQVVLNDTLKTNPLYGVEFRRWWWSYDNVFVGFLGSALFFCLDDTVNKIGDFTGAERFSFKITDLGNAYQLMHKKDNGPWLKSTHRKPWGPNSGRYRIPPSVLAPAPWDIMIEIEE